MPRLARASRTAGWRESGRGAVRASRAGSVARCASSSPTSSSFHVAKLVIPPLKRRRARPRGRSSPRRCRRGWHRPGRRRRRIVPTLARRLALLVRGRARPGRDPVPRRRPPSRPARAAARGCPRSRARAPARGRPPAARGRGASRRRREQAATGARPDANVRRPGCLGEAEITPVEPDPGHAGEGGALVPRCITIAGSDSGGGAGIQADLKAFAAAGAHGMSALVALTAQNTTGVTAIEELPPAFVVAQLDAVFDDIGVDAAKTGMLFSRRLIETVAEWLDGRGVPLVVDPVMVASSGARLLQDDAVETYVARLFPLATVVTPNLNEAVALAGADG